MPAAARPASVSARLRAVLLTPAWLPLLLMALLVGLRASKVNAVVGTYTGCHDCVLGSVLHHDLSLLAALAIVLGLELLTPWRAPRLLLRLVGIGLLLAYALDLALLTSLNQRLYRSDLLTFGAEGGAISGFLQAMMHRQDIGWWISGGLLVLAGVATALWPRRRAPAAGAAMLGLAGVALVLGFLPIAKTHYVHPELLMNLAEVNLANSADVAYSRALRQRLRLAPPQSRATCRRNPRSDRPDVILVVVESLSAYHSALLGGRMDATPQLDALARANHYFTHFVANGFNTNGGRIALYTGRTPLPPPGLARTLPLRAYAFRDGSLPDLAQQAGYASAYFTSGTLNFLDSTQWLRQLGFEHIEGAESPFYQGMKRWQFDAPEDKALFDRVLGWIDHRQDPRPFLATLLTVSSHPPFVHPETGKIDQAATFRYVDAQLARLHRKLKRRGFFEHGVLMITGDHRSMTPLYPYEYRSWGERAFARVPMVVMGDVDMPAVIHSTFAQTDVPTSFAWLVGIRTCVDAGHGNFARADPQPPRYVLHASGDRRDNVDVYFDGMAASILLDGDDSRWIGPRPVNWRAILARVNIQRIREAELARSAR